jgi:hypothetical protein
MTYTTTATSMLSNTIIVPETTASTSGGHHLALNLIKVHPHRSTIIKRIPSSRIDPSMRLQSRTHMLTPTGCPASKHATLLEEPLSAGGTIAYKTKFQPTVAGSTTEAEFMATYDTGKMILFIQSIL